MKQMVKTVLAVLAVILCMCGCNKIETPAIEYLPVTADNISGEWILVEFSGVELMEGTYMKIQFVRNDKSFVMEQNLDSPDNIPHVSTGTFNIIVDDAVGSIIKGKYDYDGGLWSHDYIVTDLTATSMTWTARDDSSYIQKFSRP
ncbi:MAG: hypothetical protein ACI3ZS_02435 [Candidatus Cryptobacteroides sp.]